MFLKIIFLHIDFFPDKLEKIKTSETKDYKILKRKINFSTDVQILVVKIKITK